MPHRIRDFRLTAAVVLGVAGGIMAAPSSATACDVDRAIGDICLVAYTYCPVGSLEADGQVLSTASYPVLFSLIQYTYGGNGSSTFALPDLRGRVALGVGQGPAQPNYVLGETGGAATVALSASQLPPHTHAIVDLPISGTWTFHGVSGTPSTAVPTGELVATPRSSIYRQSGTGMTLGSASVTVTGQVDGFTQSVGAGEPIDNRPPFLALRYCIATQGRLPG